MDVLEIKYLGLAAAAEGWIAEEKFQAILAEVKDICNKGDIVANAIEVFAESTCEDSDEVLNNEEALKERLEHSLKYATLKNLLPYYQEYKKKFNQLNDLMAKIDGGENYPPFEDKDSK